MPCESQEGNPLGPPGLELSATRAPLPSRGLASGTPPRRTDMGHHGLRASLGNRKFFATIFRLCRYRATLVPWLTPKAGLREAPEIATGRNGTMAHFMLQWKYKDTAIQAMLDKPQDRPRELRKAVEAFGGTVQHFYYTLGVYDGLAIVEFPRYRELRCLQSDPRGSRCRQRPDDHCPAVGCGRFSGDGRRRGKRKPAIKPPSATGASADAGGPGRSPTPGSRNDGRSKGEGPGRPG